MEKTKEAGIYLLKTGRYRVRATAKCPITGKMLELQKTLPASATLKEAVALRDQIKESLTKEPKAGSEITTVTHYALRWIERKAKHYEASTLKKNSSVISDFMLPVIGHIPLSRLTRIDISDWIHWAETQTMCDGRLYANDTVGSWWRVVKVILKDAHAEGHMEKDVTIRLKPPKTGISGRQEKQTLTINQLKKYVSAAEAKTPTQYVLIAVLAYTGVRIGEALGLHWGDIDFELNVFRVRFSVHNAILGPPKTKHPRVVPFPEWLGRLFIAHRQALIAVQHPGLADDIVFPARHGGYRHCSSIRKPMNALREHLKIDGRVTPQVMRRSYNTIMRESGVDTITLQEIMGHTSDAMTQRYSYVALDVKVAAVKNAFDRAPQTATGKHLGSHLGPPDATWDQSKKSVS